MCNRTAKVTEFRWALIPGLDAHVSSFPHHALWSVSPPLTGPAALSAQTKPKTDFCLQSCCLRTQARRFHLRDGATCLTAWQAPPLNVSEA